MLKFYVRTTNDRVLDKSYEQIEYTKLVDKNKDTCKFYLECLKEMSKEDSVLLEDDLILCENFRDEIEKAVSMYPDKIISFFSTPTLYIKTRENKLRGFLQCYYFPKDKAKETLTKLEKLDLRNFKKVVPMLIKIDLEIVEYRPCLVQHLDLDSLVGNKCGKRRTPYFLDYLKEINVDYDNAYAYENELISLMNEKFESS